MYMYEETGNTALNTCCTVAGHRGHILSQSFDVLGADFVFYHGCEMCVCLLTVSCPFPPPRVLRTVS